jgi:protein-disulfide isomerase
LMLVGLLLPTLLWVFAKRPLTAALTLRPTQKDLLKLKNNPALFTALLYQQPKLRGHLPVESVVRLGQATAPHTLTVATSPTCGPCARLHKELTKLLTDNDLINVNLVFTVFGSPNDSRRVIVETILALPPDQRTKALDTWFTDIRQDPVQWATGFTSVNPPLNRSDWVTHHQNWHTDNQIEATPTVFVDGWKMPEQYSLEEIVTLLPHLNKMIMNT